MSAGPVGLRPLRWWDIAWAQALDARLHGADGWSVPLFWSELAQPDRRYLVAERAGELLGFAGLALFGGEGSVQTVAVRPDRWGQGVGGALLAGLLERAGDRPVLLEVRVDNERAQALYQRFGFAAVGRRRGYYQPSGADALVMRRG